MTTLNFSSPGGWQSLEEAYLHSRIWCIDEQFFFGNGLSYFVLHVGPSVEAQMSCLVVKRFLISGWPGQLPIKSTTVLSWAQKKESSFLIHSPKRSPVIQLFFWLLYQQRSCLIFLKHLGVMDLPTTYMGNFFPVALAVAMPVSRGLLFFPPEHFSPAGW